MYTYTHMYTYIYIYGKSSHVWEVVPCLYIYIYWKTYYV